MKRSSIPVQQQQQQQPAYQSFANSYSPPPQQQQPAFFPSNANSSYNAPANFYDVPSNQYAQTYMPPPQHQNYSNSNNFAVPLTSHPNAPPMTVSKPSASLSSPSFPQQMQHQLTTDTSSSPSYSSPKSASGSTATLMKKPSTPVVSAPSPSLREATMKKYKSGEALLVDGGSGKEKQKSYPNEDHDESDEGPSKKKKATTSKSSSLSTSGPSTLASTERLVTINNAKPLVSSAASSSTKSKSTRRGSLERVPSKREENNNNRDDDDDFVLQKAFGKVSAKKSEPPVQKKSSSLWGADSKKKESAPLVKENVRIESPIANSKSAKKAIPVSKVKVAKNAYQNEDVEDDVAVQRRAVVKKHVMPDAEEDAEYEQHFSDDENDDYDGQISKKMGVATSMGQRGRSSSITSSPLVNQAPNAPIMQQQRKGGFPQDFLLAPPAPVVPDWLVKVQKDFDVQLTQEWINILLENEIDFDSFFLLTEKTLAELGLPLGARLKILKVIDSDKKKKAATKMAGAGSYSYMGGGASWAGGFESETPSTSTDDSTSASSVKPLDEASEKVMQTLILKFPRNLVIQHCDLTILHANQIGRGGFGSVVEGRLSGRPVAVKLFDDVECGIEECVITSGLYHKNVISLLAVTVCPSQQRSSNLMAKVATLGGRMINSSALNLGSQPRLAMVMELAEGSLLQLLQSPSGPTLDFDLITRYVIQIAQALAFLHTRKPMVLHLDLKPGNLLLTQDLTTVKLCDFSISKQSQKAQTTITSCVGTPIYMCFQQFVLGSQMDPSFDCYSFGAVLSYLISGEEPYGGRLQNFVGMDGKATPLVDLVKPRKDCPEFLIKICKECLSVDPALRPKNGEVLLNMVMEGCKGFAPSLVTGIAAAQMIGSGSSSSEKKINDNNSNNTPSSSSSSSLQNQRQGTSSSSGNENNNNNNNTSDRSGNNKSYSSNSWTGRSGNNNNNAGSQNQDVTEVIEFGNDDF